MFSEAFLSTPTDEIIEALRVRGVFALEGALEPGVADEILTDVDDLKFTINHNRPPNVVYRGQTFANHFLAVSQAAFEIVTHDRVTGVLRAGLGDNFRMVGKRVYETRSESYMQFHSDAGAPCKDPRQLDTIVFIFYLNDVEQGEWEIIEGSHLWGENMSGSMSDDEVLLARDDVSVAGFKMPKGSLVIYNGRTLHRARMFKDPAWARRSLFFQVNRNSPSSEPMLVNAGYIRPDLSEDAKMLLGFGKPGTFPAFPRAAPKFMPIGSFPAMDKYLTHALPVRQLAAMLDEREARRAAKAAKDASKETS